MTHIRHSAGERARLHRRREHSSCAKKQSQIKGEAVGVLLASCLELIDHSVGATQSTAQLATEIG